MDILNFVKRVRSVRQYQDKPVEEQTILRILEAGRWSGSAKNVQPWRYILVQDKARLKRLSECGRFATHMPDAAFVVVVAMPEGSFADFDAGRTIQNMLIAAWGEGVGSCVVTLHDEAQVREVLGIPEGYTVRHTVTFGYPPEGPLQPANLPNRGRKPIEEILFREGWDDSKAE
jgi:nitroreductase